MSEKKKRRYEDMPVTIKTVPLREKKFYESDGFGIFFPPIKQPSKDKFFGRIIIQSLILCVFICLSKRLVATVRQNQDAYFISRGILVPHVNLFPAYRFNAVCSIFTHNDTQINHMFVRTQAEYMLSCR